MKYYLKDKGIIKGPIDESIIRKRLKEKIISQEAMVSKDERTWQNAIDVFKFAQKEEVKNKKQTEIIDNKTSRNIEIHGTSQIIQEEDNTQDLHITREEVIDLFDAFCMMLYVPDKGIGVIFKLIKKSWLLNWIWFYFYFSLLISLTMLFGTFSLIGHPLLCILVFPIVILCAWFLQFQHQKKAELISIHKTIQDTHFFIEYAGVWYIFMWSSLFMSVGIFALMQGLGGFIIGMLLILASLGHFFYQYWVLTSYDYLSLIEFTHKKGDTQ